VVGTFNRRSNLRRHPRTTRVPEARGPVEAREGRDGGGPGGGIRDVESREGEGRNDYPRVTVNCLLLLIIYTLISLIVAGIAGVLFWNANSGLTATAAAVAGSFVGAMWLCIGVDNYLRRD
jgi:hypothetical protein